MIYIHKSSWIYRSRTFEGDLHVILNNRKNILILASASTVRASLLDGAGLNFRTMPSNIDESSIKKLMNNKGAGPTAQKLAEQKAKFVSNQNSDAYVVGCDQLLDCDGEWFDKPTDVVDLRRQLLSLRGREHSLLTSICIFHQQSCIWSFTDSSTLRMRNFSESFLEHYISSSGSSALQCVGGYKLEGLGAQLFEKVEGDYFSILGLPLFPLLEVLRSYRVIPL